MLLVSAGMRRSGSTLQYNLARDLLEITERGTPEGYLPHEEFSESEDRLIHWMRADRFHLVKSHVFPGDVGGAEGSVRFLHVHRDLRSVAASMKEKWETTEEELLESLSREVRRDRALEREDRVLVQRYDDLVNGLPGSVEGIASFLELEVDESAARRVAERNDLERTRRKIRRLRTGPGYWVNRLLSWLGVRWDFYDEGTLLHADHITSEDPSRPRWHDALSRREREAIEEEFAGWLQERGYLQP